MKTGGRLCLLLVCLALAPAAALGEWQAVEKVQTYHIAGVSGPELYVSIGERGPKVGGLSRAIAHTSFKLTWTRKYEAHGDACVLVSAVPRLAITYTLPEPAKPLPVGTKERWQVFISGVYRHELVHGEYIKEMVRKIEATTVGLTVPADPKCHKIKAEMTKRLGTLSNAQRLQSRQFDRAELSNGGNVHQLILQLVNGG
ncbi:DUF922 domain-containing Zn-dependent protease [Sinorhizobium alkalisoli]|uniref:Peptidase n=1 Tax=Sinorhizobium alkalisoli TaxID=1752398 RepID=A0A1E3VGZ4_9HYPH|nr:DUF922 domain-containing protein [Sinorhizobium alkalisoli]MCA1491340.1 DUF922 domain-containing protein [Ensifer sp. NBAIM29]MCG5478951.1 DUF922 domain-containing protein [Sinorhizobium alkalisoli]ODR92845.1 peptidase [Sinorhizobium alkalisoli]